MKTKLFILVFAVISIVACGPSKEEREAQEKANMDSIAKAAQEDLLKQQEHADSQKKLKEELIDLNAKLVGEEAKLQNINEFKLLRTIEEKAKQLESQTKVVEKLKAQISEVEKQIE